MRIRTGLCLLICCGALAACTAAPRKGPDTIVSTPSVGRPPAPASAQAALSDEAFTPYAALGTSNDDGLAPGESGFNLFVACVSAAGYPSAADNDLELFGVGGGNLSTSQPWGAWGYLGAADAQQYGFGSALIGLSSMGIVDAGTSNSAASPSPAEQAAANKCGTIERGFVNAVATGPLAGIGTLSKDIANDVGNDASVQAATRAWSACMAKNGYNLDQPQSVYQQEAQAMYGGKGNIITGAPISASVQRAQLAAAVTDADCTQSSDLAGIYFAVQASYERQLVTANQQALAAAVSQYRAAYKKELTKLAAQLRTAKAQPFSPAKRPARPHSRAS
jgi:hypothetical protein